ncbi:hypothetical protein D3C75_670730 [compost metagenome]
MRRVRLKSLLRSSKVQFRVRSWPTAFSLSRRTARKSKNICGLIARTMSTDTEVPAWGGTPLRSSMAPVRYMLRQVAFSL